MFDVLLILVIILSICLTKNFKHFVIFWYTVAIICFVLGLFVKENLLETSIFIGIATFASSQR